MKLNLLAVFNNLKLSLERHLFNIGVFLFISSLLFSILSWQDSKTSIHSSDYEIYKTCDIVDGLGDNTASLLICIRDGKTTYNSFEDVKSDFYWLNVKLINKNFKFGSDLMRFEFFKMAIQINVVINIISFIIILSSYLYKKYRHHHVFNSLKQLIKSDTRGGI